MPKATLQLTKYKDKKYLILCPNEAMFMYILLTTNILMLGKQILTTIKNYFMFAR